MTRSSRPLALAKETLARTRDLLVAKTGPLTRDLLQRPADFGLGHVPARLTPDATVRTVCGFCSTGCALQVHLRDGEAINLSPARDYPVNLGMACPKGWEALTPLRADDRATTPLLRNERGERVAVDWGTALETMVSRLKGVQAKYGPESVAFLGTGQAATEELAFLGSLCKFGMGIVHGDGNTRQCMATAVAAYKQSFGFDAPPFTYADFEASDVLVGSNLCIAHPIMWERICRNPHRPAIVVIDPRTTETAMAATHHVPIRPKSDLTFFYGLANALIERGWVDHEFVRAHTSGFEGLKAHVASFTLERVCHESGIPLETLETLLRLLHEGKRVSFWWTMGVNQSHEGVRVAQAIINLALLTGNIGRPGTGANSITGQCNAMGSRLFSNTTNLLGGHDFTNAEHREKIARVLEIDEAVIPRVPSLAYDQILEGVVDGRIRALWIVGTNPAHSWIDQNALHEALSRLEFLVVQDMYASTETAVLADLLLPAAGWGEKEGTFINSERRIGRIKKVARPPGQAIADFDIFRLVAEAWGCGPMLHRFASPEAVFRLLAECSRGQPCDITGIANYAMLDAHDGIQWPYPEGSPPESPERRLFEDGAFFHQDGRARFVFEAPRSLPEPTSETFPFFLMTGRGSSSQWHTQTRTKKSAVLRSLSPSDVYVEINPADAERLGIADAEWVEVVSARGSLRAKSFVTQAVRPGHLFIPMHYETMNVLTFASFDPYSRQPAYKASAVRLTKIEAEPRGGTHPADPRAR